MFDYGQTPNETPRQTQLGRIITVAHDSGRLLEKLFGLDGQVAAVVGGAGRIGRSLCGALAQAGAKVAVLDAEGPSAAALAGEIQDATGRRCQGLEVDATKRDDLDRAVDAIKAELGPARILVNAAQYRGPGFYASDVSEYPREIWDKVLDVNLTAVFQACQAFAAVMADHGGGRIVNLASTYGVVSPDPRIYGDSGVNSPAPYAASKAGVIQLTRYLAVHLREQRIRVNCLVPGGVFDQQDDSFVASYCERTVLGRMASADDYQGAVLFMVSTASDYMTGATVTVDGGWTAW